jgi:hypothetical protein
VRLRQPELAGERVDSRLFHSNPERAIETTLTPPRATAEC